MSGDRSLKSGWKAIPLLSYWHIAAFDEQPIILACAGKPPLSEPHERPATLHHRACQFKIDLALIKPATRMALWRPGSRIPQDHAAGSVLPFGNFALENPILKRMIVNLYGEPVRTDFSRWLFGHGPALEHAVMLEPEVIVKPRRVVFPGLPQCRRSASEKARESARPGPANIAEQSPRIRARGQRDNRQCRGLLETRAFARLAPRKSSQRPPLFKSLIRCQNKRGTFLRSALRSPSAGRFSLG